MRSFARAVKEEILLVERTKEENKIELSALIQFLGTISLSNRGLSVVVKTENPEISRFVMKMAKEYYDVSTETSIVRKMKLNKNKVYYIRILKNAKEMLEDLGLWTKDGIMDHPNLKQIKKLEYARAYLAGCFLSSGSVNDPKKTDYHLEMSALKQSQGEYMIKAFETLGYPVKMIKRRNQYVVYLKSVERINDFLVHIGANECALEYADVRIQRDIFNNYTRLENCATANEVKSIKTGLQQVKAIEHLKEIGRFDYLDNRLIETANIRLAHPEDSLAELANKYELETGIPISKSGIKHRLEKIVELAGIEK